MADRALRLLDFRRQKLLLVWRENVSVTNLVARLAAASSIGDLIERAAEN